MGALRDILTQGNSLTNRKKKKKKCVPKHKEPKMRDVVLSETANRIERVRIPEKHIKRLKERRKAKPKPKIPKTPHLPGRNMLAYQGPYPVEYALAVLRAHVYYLYGEVKHLQEASVGSSVEALANRLKELSREADQAAHRVIANAHIPTITATPNFPVAVASAPCFLQLLCPPPWRQQVAESSPRCARVCAHSAAHCAPRRRLLRRGWPEILAVRDFL